MRISWENVDKYGNNYKLVENYSIYGFVFDCADDMEQAVHIPQKQSTRSA